MPYYKKVIRSGDVYEAEVYFSLREKGKKIPRTANRYPTTAKQEDINLKNAQRELSRIINANFKPGDLFITLTYDTLKEPDTEEEAKALLKKYLRKLRTFYRRAGKESKYVVVTERGEKGRIHHHLVIPHEDRDELDKLWEHGNVLSSRLWEKKDYTRLANYITKDTKPEHKKRWSGSHNLVKPEVSQTVISRGERAVKPPKGYRQVEFEYYISEETGAVQYLRAIREGGQDIGRGDGGENEKKIRQANNSREAVKRWRSGSSGG